MAVTNLYPVLTVEQAKRVEQVVAEFGKRHIMRFSEKRAKGARVIKYYGLTAMPIPLRSEPNVSPFYRKRMRELAVGQKIVKKLAKEGIHVFAADDRYGSLKFVTVTEYRKV